MTENIRKTLSLFTKMYNSDDYFTPRKLLNHTSTRSNDVSINFRLVSFVRVELLIVIRIMCYISNTISWCIQLFSCRNKQNWFLFDPNKYVSARINGTLRFLWIHCAMSVNHRHKNNQRIYLNNTNYKTIIDICHTVVVLLSLFSSSVSHIYK